MIYKWSGKYGQVDIDAQAAGEEIEAIGQHVTPKAVVDKARDEGSVLHQAFEWDDAAAGEKWREEQAQWLLRHLVVVVEREGANEERSIRAFVNVTDQEERSYMPVHTVLQDADLRVQVLRRAWSELQSWKRRYQEYEELAAVFTAISRSAKKLERLAS